MDKIKLGDLGCARSITTSITPLTYGVGTTPYICPEMKKNERYDFKSDIW
jgi:serine/threonine protein kinase